MGSFVRVDRPVDKVGLVMLQRTIKRNALSIGLRDEVSAAIETLVQDETVSVLVLTGASGVFSTGFDLQEFGLLDDPDSAARLWASSDRFHQTIMNCPLPTVAAVNGQALAGGFDLAVMCDMRIAAASAVFAHPEVVFGDVVYAPLQELLGGAIARDLCLTGRKVSADEALALGLVSRVVPDNELLPAAFALAAEIARSPRHLLQRVKGKILARAALDFSTTLDL